MINDPGFQFLFIGPPSVSSISSLLLAKKIDKKHVSNSFKLFAMHYLSVPAKF